MAAGMVNLGKTHTVEFAYGVWGINQHLGTPWNPWDDSDVDPMPELRRDVKGTAARAAAQ